MLVMETNRIDYGFRNSKQGQAKCNYSFRRVLMASDSDCTRKKYHSSLRSANLRSLCSLLVAFGRGTEVFVRFAPFIHRHFYPDAQSAFRAKPTRLGLEAKAFDVRQTRAKIGLTRAGIATIRTSGCAFGPWLSI